MSKTACWSFATIVLAGTTAGSALAAPVVIQGNKVGYDYSPTNVPVTTISVTADFCIYSPPNTGHLELGSSSANPYSISFNTPEDGHCYGASSSMPAGYDVQASACVNCTSHPPDSFVDVGPSGGLRTLGMLGSVSYVDIQWRYTIKPTISVATPMVKIVPAAVPPYPITEEGGTTSNTAWLTAARNEFEAFQVVIYNNRDTDLPGIDVSVDPLGGPNQAVIPASNIRVYREAYVQTLKPSNKEALLPGPIPDPLVPLVDEGYGGAPETRSAFYHFSPESLVDEYNQGCTSPSPPSASTCNRIPPKKNRVLWVDVFVPPRLGGQQTPAGLYGGGMTIKYDGMSVVLLLYVTVRDFELQSTATLASRFNMSGNQICAAHFGSAPCDEPAMRRLYGRLLLDHRVSSEVAMKNDNTPWDQFRTDYLPLMNGTDPLLLLKGAQLTTLNYVGGNLDVRDPTLNNLDLTRHQAWARELDGSLYTIPRTNPNLTWFKRTMDYICDEPSRASSTCSWALTGQTDPRAACPTSANPPAPTILRLRAQNANPLGFNTFTAASIDDVQCRDLSYASDLKTIGPTVTGMDVKRPNENREEAIDLITRTAKDGRQRDKYPGVPFTWWYQSCALQGCNHNFTAALNPDFYDNWPSYYVDAPTMHQHRALEWLSYANDISGEFYWDVVSQLPNAWSSMPFSPDVGPNGDGDLMYPGTPVAPSTSGLSIGGTRHIPIASLRLKMIREGMEDYEYLKMMEKLDPSGGRSNALMQVTPLFAPGVPLGTATTSYHAFNSGKGAGMLATRTPPNDLMSARRNLADQIFGLSVAHAITLTLTGHTASSSTYRVEATSTPGGAPLQLVASSPAVQLSTSSITAGTTTAVATVSAACPTAQSSSFAVTATRSATGQERSTAASLPQTFSAAVSPGSATIPPAGTAYYTISTATAGSPQLISCCSITGLPAGVTASVSPSSFTAGQSATLALTAPANSSSSTGTFTVTASGCEPKSASAVLSVSNPCSAPYSYCPATATCRNLSTDRNNCGACGYSCGTDVCSGGTCVPPPPPSCKPPCVTP